MYGNFSIKKEKKAMKNNVITKRCKFTKKTVLTIVTAAIMCCLFCVTAFAAAGGTGEVNSTDFIEKAGTVLKSVIILIGGGVGVWGVVNLLEGYGNDNAGSKSQGMKQLMAGLGLILLAVILIPVLMKMMSDAA